MLRSKASSSVFIVELVRAVCDVIGRLVERSEPEAAVLGLDLAL